MVSTDRTSARSYSFMTESRPSGATAPQMRIAPSTGSRCPLQYTSKAVGSLAARRNFANATDVWWRNWAGLVSRR